MTTLAYESCTFTYRQRRGFSLRSGFALQELSYELPAGLTVLLGPNGAGKSTTLRLGASVTRPRSGRVRLGDLAAGSRDFRQQVAWLPQQVTAMPSLTSREYVAYVGWLKGMSRADAWTRAAHALERVELTDKADEKSSRLSGGQLRRLGVAGALVHDAAVLLLDEPTAGMDPRQRRVFHTILRSLADDVRVLLSTHDVADLAEEADHVAVMHRGRLIHEGTTEAFLAHTPPGTPPGRAAEAAYDQLLPAQ